MNRNSGKTDRKAVGSLTGLGSAAAIVGAGIAAMATGSVTTAAPQPDHSGVQTATLTQATTGTVDKNAGFVTPPTPVPSTPSLSGSPAPKDTPVFPGVTQDTTSSANNPGGNTFPFLPLTSQAGIAPTPSGLSLNPSTSNNDPLGFGNVGVAPAGRVTFNADGTTTVNPGGVFAISTPWGGGSSTFGFPLTIDNQGNVKFTAWDPFINGLVNLPGLKNTTNTTGFASDQPANPNFDTNAPFGGTPTGDPQSKQTFNNLFSALQNIDAANTAAVNSLNVPTMEQLFPSGFPGDTTSGPLLGVPGLGNAAAGNFSTFGAIAPTSDNAVNTFAPRDPANPSAVGIPQDFANIDAMFPNAVNSFAPVNTSSGIPTFQDAYQAALAAGNGAGGGAATSTPRSIVIPGNDGTGNGTGAPAGGQPGGSSDPTLGAPASGTLNPSSDPTLGAPSSGTLPPPPGPSSDPAPAPLQQTAVQPGDGGVSAPTPIVTAGGFDPSSGYDPTSSGITGA